MYNRKFRLPYRPKFFNTSYFPEKYYPVNIQFNHRNPLTTVNANYSQKLKINHKECEITTGEVVVHAIWEITTENLV